MERCPYCYSLKNIWTDDPLLTLNGSKYIWTAENVLKYEKNLESRTNKGLTFIKRQHILELQAIRKETEESLGLSPTEFSNIEDKEKIFRVHKKYIQELRNSTEQILNALGMEKNQYFNCNEEGIEIEKYGINEARQTQVDWTDVDLENYKGLIKNTHIEDLRRPFLGAKILCLDPVTQCMVDQAPEQTTGMTTVEQPGFGSPNEVIKDYTLLNDAFYEWNEGNGYFYDAPYECRFNMVLVGEKVYYLKYRSANDSSDTIDTHGIPFEFEDFDIKDFRKTYIHGEVAVLTKTLPPPLPETDFELYLTEYSYVRMGVSPTLKIDEAPASFPMYIAKYSVPQTRVLGVSAGQVKQTYNITSKLDWNKIKDYINDYNLFILVSNTQWIKVDNFTNSDKNSPHYTFIGGTVTFGDGKKGKIPPVGAYISVKLKFPLAVRIKLKFEGMNEGAEDKTKSYYNLCANNTLKVVYAIKDKYPNWIAPLQFGDIKTTFSGNNQILTLWTGDEHINGTPFHITSIDVKSGKPISAQVEGDFLINNYLGPNKDLLLDMKYLIHAHTDAPISSSESHSSPESPDLIPSSIVSQNNFTLTFPTSWGKVDEDGPHLYDIVSKFDLNVIYPGQKEYGHDLINFPYFYRSDYSFKEQTYYSDPPGYHLDFQNWGHWSCRIKLNAKNFDSNIFHPKLYLVSAQLRGRVYDIPEEMKEVDILTQSINFMRMLYFVNWLGETAMWRIPQISRTNDELIFYDEGSDPISAPPNASATFRVVVCTEEEKDWFSQVLDLSIPTEYTFTVSC